MGSPCCDEHLCGIRNCPEPIIPPFEFCNRHKCAVWDCHRPRKASIQGFLGQSGDGLCCDGHTCSQHGCRNRVSEDSGWCLEHVMVCRNGTLGGRRRISFEEDEEGYRRRAHMRPG